MKMLRKPSSTDWR